MLTEVLEQAGLQRRLLGWRGLDDQVALRFPCARSIGFHVVTHGTVFIHAEALATPLVLVPGDIALMARGCNHVLSTQQVAPPDSRVSEVRTGLDDATSQPRASTGAVISGAYQLSTLPMHPFFGELPDWYVVRGASLPRLSPISLTIALLGTEAETPDLGSDIIVRGLMDATFAYLLREIVAQTGQSRIGWSKAVGSPRIRQVVMLMHQDAARALTLDKLAASVGLSRTVLAQRFRESMGDTPLNYLRAVRMQKAMRLLADSDNTLETVAAQVGYRDAFSFSKVFKRTVGHGPREFRRQQAVDRVQAWSA